MTEPSAALTLESKTSTLPKRRSRISLKKKLPKKRKAVAYSLPKAKRRKSTKSE
jgi:hypothetical protein